MFWLKIGYMKYKLQITEDQVTGLERAVQHAERVQKWGRGSGSITGVYLLRPESTPVELKLAQDS